MQYSPTFNYSEKEEEEELDYQKSQTLVIRKEKENIVSGIHEKYLRSDNFVSKKGVQGLKQKVLLASLWWLSSKKKTIY